MYKFLRYFSSDTTTFIKKTDKKIIKNTVFLGTTESHALPIKLDGKKVSIFNNKLDKDKNKDLSKFSDKEIQAMRKLAV